MKTFRISERIKTLGGRTEQIKDSELRGTGYSEETKTVLDAMKTVYKDRRIAFEKATPKIESDVRFVGAGSAGFGPDFVDWRSQLPPNHPVRQIGPPVIENGSPEAEDQLLAAHNALQAAMRTSNAPLQE